MWENFDPESIEGDLKLLSEVGITHLRVFPLWPVFQPLYGIYGASNVYEYTFKDGKELPDTEAGRAGVSEEACRKFEEFLSLCNKYNMKLIVAERRDGRKKQGFDIIFIFDSCNFKNKLGL